MTTPGETGASSGTAPTSEPAPAGSTCRYCRAQLPDEQPCARCENWRTRIAVAAEAYGRRLSAVEAEGCPAELLAEVLAQASGASVEQLREAVASMGPPPP